MPIQSLSKNLIFSSPSCSYSSSSTYFSSLCNSRISLSPSCFCSFGSKPISLWSKKIQSLQYKAHSRGVGSLRYKKRQKPIVLRSEMTISEIREEGEEENPPPFVESEISLRPRRIALFVEPSPFA